MPITIRPVETRDIPAIRDIYACPKAQAGTLQLPFPSLALWEKRLGDIPQGVYSLLAEEEEGRVVGQLGFEVCSNPRRRHVAQFSMAVHDQYSGQGVGSKLLDSMVDLADNWLNIRRIELTVYRDNNAAIALYRKYGFEVEGEAPGFAFRNGKYVDALYMARFRPQSID